MSINQPPTSTEFRAALDALLDKADKRLTDFADVRSGDLHKAVGWYPGPDHRMPVCCGVMRAAMKTGDQVLRAPPKGNGANLIIRYSLPR